MWKVLSHGLTHVGLERKNNEDSFRIAADAGLYLVCDGMGGHASGEIASQIAADVMVRFVALEQHRPDFRWPEEVLAHEIEELRTLDTAVRLANGSVFAGALANPAHKGMGTTIVGVLAGPQRLGLVHVGDSRIYRLRGSALEQLTEDHSLLNHYIRSRPMSAEQIRQFVGKNVIVRAVGLRDEVEPDVQEQDYCAGDLYLLCSDGLTDMVTDEVLERELIAGRDDLATASQRLIDLALEGGGKDNVTLVLLRVVLVTGEWRPHSRETLPLVAMDTTPGFDARQAEVRLTSDTQPVPRIAKELAATQEVVRPSTGRHLIEAAQTAPGVDLPQRRIWERSTGRMPRVRDDQLTPQSGVRGVVVGTESDKDPNEITAPVLGSPFGTRPPQPQPIVAGEADSAYGEENTAPVHGGSHSPAADPDSDSEG